MAKQKSNSQSVPAVPKDPLAEIDLAFLQMRRRFLRFSKIAGVSSLTFLSALFFGCFSWDRTWLTPFTFSARLHSNALTPSALKDYGRLIP